MGFVAYSPLGRKFLTGQVKSADDLPAGDRYPDMRWVRVEAPTTS